MASWLRQKGVAGSFILLWLTGILGNILPASQTCGCVNPYLFGEIHQILGEDHRFLSIPMGQRW
jgi:hypothetical protein